MAFLLLEFSSRGSHVKIRLKNFSPNACANIEELMGRIKKPSREKDNVNGRYANYFKVGYNAYEFVIDFCQYHSVNGCCFEIEKAELCERFITSPAYAKALMNVLRKSIKEYEDTFGFIEEEENGFKRNAE